MEEFLFGKYISNSSVKRKVSGESAISSSSSSSGEEDENESCRINQKAVDKKQQAKEESSSDGEDDECAGRKETEEEGKRTLSWEREKANSSKKDKKKPAWHDNDDDQTQGRDITVTFTKAKGKHGGKETSKNVKNITKNFYESMGMHPLMVRKEVPGHISDTFTRDPLNSILKL